MCERTDKQTDRQTDRHTGTLIIIFQTRCVVDMTNILCEEAAWSGCVFRLSREDFGHSASTIPDDKWQICLWLYIWREATRCENSFAADKLQHYVVDVIEPLEPDVRFHYSGLRLNPCRLSRLIRGISLHGFHRLVLESSWQLASDVFKTKDGYMYDIKRW